MTRRLVHHDSDAASNSRLQPLYQRRLIPPEKKPVVVDLESSKGPFLAVDGRDEYILDACSQIATLGLGFNASPLFAPCQHAESWTGDDSTANIQRMAAAYRALLQRCLGQTAADYHVHFCASGAEAIEIALITCFSHRKRSEARRVLAFEGSFHGRTMVALAASWNPHKREPFAWPGYEATFVPYPAIEVQTPADRRQPSEDESLAAIEDRLASGNYFAIVIEPMQCEGGDRYSSQAFHQRLMLLANAYHVPVVYDEVQTGFHLGDRFFWHSQFELRDADGQPQSPAVITCAKKAQVGVVISQFEIDGQERFCPASLIRGHAVASVIDQFDDQIATLSQRVQTELKLLTEKYGAWITNPRGQGSAFAFDFRDPALLKQMVGQRFKHGLLFYPAGQVTARFRLNLSFHEDEQRLLWQQLDRCLATVTGGATGSPRVDLSANLDSHANYNFHQDLVMSKCRQLAKQAGPVHAVLDYVQRQLEQWAVQSDLQVVVLNQDRYAEYRDRILQMQSLIYEPARQTPVEEFDRLFDNDHSIVSPALLVLNDDRIVAMASCGPISCFQDERGVAIDEWLNDERVFYMLDLTVVPEFRGGMGRVMKSALALLAAERGIDAIHGRNRDRLARGMWAINIALGSYQLQHLVDDYPDQESHRDCLYYRLPLSWALPDVRPSAEKLGTVSLDLQRVSGSFFQRNMPALVNKICLSNFVTETFLEDLEFVAGKIPSQLRHLYTCSGLSEAVEKVTKAIWLRRPTSTRLLTVADHDFGDGTFLTRSLSGVGEAYFDVFRLETQGLYSHLQSVLSDESFLAMYVNVEDWKLGFDELARCRQLCRKHQLPVIYNETGPRFGSPSQVSLVPELEPDAGVVWLGGQMALAFINDSLFVDDPLWLISTWDGDAYALARFAELMRQNYD